MMGTKRVLVTLAALASGGLTACVSIGDLDWSDPHMADFQQSEPLQGEERIEADISLNVGKLEIQAGSPANVYEAELRYNSQGFEPRLEYSRTDGRGRLQLALSGEGKAVRRARGNHLNLRLNPDLPLRLEARSGVGESHIDLSGMHVENVALKSGVGESRLLMLSPNPTTCERLQIHSGVGSLEVTGLGNFAFRRFEFHGGVGGSVLDFSGSWEEVGDMEIAVGVGGLEIRIPRDIGAEIRASKSFLSGFDLREFRKEGDTYYSENLDRVSKVIRLRIRAGIGGVSVRWM